MQTETIHTLLDDLDAGVFIQKVERAMRDTALAVVSTGKKGQVAIIFDLKQIGSSNQVEIEHAVKFKRPTDKGSVSEDNATMTPVYVCSGGKLSIMPDNQMELEGIAKRGERPALKAVEG